MKKLKPQFSDNLLTTSRHEIQSSNPIPVDLLIDIFSRVPGESIARFRCVSKFWASILRRPDFTELFLTKSLSRPRIFFALNVNGKLFFYSSPQPQNPDDNSFLVATPYHTFPEYFLYGIRKTVCGLVLCKGYRREVRVICNPATGKYITLPNVLLKDKNLPKVKAESIVHDPMKIAGMYFGYDPVGKQFKVLCMTSSRYVRPTTHWVLTLESGESLWRPVEREILFVKNRSIHGEICINGVLYFGSAFGRYSVIVCFNFRSEKFGFINTNEEMGLEYPHVIGSLTLFNYKGKLGIHHEADYRYWNSLVLWVLEDAGNHKWSKHTYALSFWDDGIVRFHNHFVGMTGTGEIVWSSYHELSHSFYLVFYNLERNTITRVNIQGFEEFNYHRYVALDTFVDYVENLKLV